MHGFLDDFIPHTSAQFLKCGNKRDGDDDEESWAGVPRPTAGLAG
jgi:hypothetical protein